MRTVTEDNLERFISNIQPFSPLSISDLDKEITYEETRAALKRLPFKAPGALGIPVTIYKEFDDLLIPLITKIANNAMSNRTIPSELLNAIITLIPKQDKDPHYADNLRPIFLLEPLRKLIELIMQNRLYNALIESNVIGDHQNCHPKRNIEENILTHLFLSQYAKETNTNIYCLLTDFRKAFDLVQHQYIEKILSAYKLTPRTINFLMCFLKGSGRIKFGAFKSDPFDILCGTPQGSVLSPFLFILAIEPLLRTIKNEIQGVKISTLDLKLKSYADDLSIYFLCIREIEKAIKIIQDYCEISGSQLNKAKCSIMNICKQEQHDPICEIHFTQTSERILGVMFDSNGVVNNLDTKIDLMTSKAIVIKKFYPSFSQKLNYFKTYILSIILFLAPYITATKQQLERVQDLCDWFLCDKKTFIPQKTQRDIARLQNKIENGGSNLFSFKHYLKSTKTKMLIRCASTEYQNKTYIIILKFILHIRYKELKKKTNLPSTSSL